MQQKEMIDMGQFLALLKRRWIEKTVYTRASKKFSISVEELPPFIAPSVASDAVNTEIKKKSVYLAKDTSG